jgi:tetratricopeptide (TPR) repeat protein
MTPEVEDELRELKREVIESRGLVIKTNNLANGLSADLKSIAKRQAGYERQITWNSATAYAVFVLVVLIGLKVLWDYRLDNVRTETEGSRGELENLRKQLKDLEHLGDARGKLEARAQAVYELARNGKRADFLDQIDQLPKDSLTKTEQVVFQDIAERYRNELALERYTAGLEHVRVARWQEAATAFEEALKIKPDATTTPSTKLALAQSYRKLARPRDAIPILQALADTAVDRDVQASAQWELAQVEVEIQAWNDAKAALRAFLKKWPDHARSLDARQQLQDLQSKH